MAARRNQARAHRNAHITSDAATAAEVVAGSAAASLSNVLPVNVIGNLGTLEAGWTAAFTALGVPVSVAAATGLASHLWALLFAAVYGAVAWLVITRRNPRESN